MSNKKLFKGQNEHLGFLGVHTFVPKSISDWLKSLGLSSESKEELTSHNFLWALLIISSLAINLDKILLTFPSKIGAGKSKAEEIILPAVVLPIPGSDVHWLI